MNIFTQWMQDPLAAQIVIWSGLLLVAGTLLTPKFRTPVLGVVAVIVAALMISLGLRMSSPLMVGTMLGATGLVCLLPPSRTDLRVIGALFFAVAIGFYAYAVASQNTMPALAQAIEWGVFGLLAFTTVGSAVGMVSSRSAVYSAIWFAMALLGTGGLFLYQGAQFLGVATVVVYAGAIVVTFLFVIMLAQPDGHATYDRISWGWFAKPAAALASALLMGAILYGLEGLDRGGVQEAVVRVVDEFQAAEEPLPFTGAQVARASLNGREGAPKLELQLTSEAQAVKLSAADEARLASSIAKQLKVTDPVAITLKPALGAAVDPQSGSHMAHLGGHLFSRHLVAVEVAGTLLLAALVGAVAMLSQGGSMNRREGDAHV